MNPSEIREAVEYAKRALSGHPITPLLSLAEAWLGRKMVEKNINNLKSEYDNGYNDAIDACRLAMPSVVSEEGLANLIQGVSVTNEDILHGNQLNTLSYHHCIKLAHAIAEYVNGGGR
jgi:hypothetical protein